MGATIVRDNEAEGLSFGKIVCNNELYRGFFFLDENRHLCMTIGYFYNEDGEIDNEIHVYDFERDIVYEPDYDMKIIPVDATIHFNE